MKVLITGATGAIGRELVSYLRRNEGYRLMTVNRSIEKAEKLFGSSDRLIHTSIEDADLIVQFEPEVVIHLASHVTSACDFEAGQKLLESNIGYGVRLLEIIKRVPSFRLFLNFGTFAEYRSGYDRFDNAYLYSASKTAFRAFAEFYASISSFTLIHLVPYTVYGTHDERKKIFDYIYEGFFGKVPVSMSPGMQMLDFIHVFDVCRIIEKTLNIKDLSKYNYQNIWLGTGKVHTLREVANIMQRLLNIDPLHDWGKLPYRDKDVMYAAANMNPLIELGCEPQIPLEEGIREFLKKKSHDV